VNICVVLLFVFCFDARIFSISLSFFKIFFSSLPSILNLKNAYLLNLKSETLSGKDKRQFFLEALQPNHQRSLPAGHFTNVSQVKGEPTSFNWCSQPRVKGSRFVEKVKPKR
jgi:hypothetical protein